MQDLIEDYFGYDPDRPPKDFAAILRVAYMEHSVKAFIVEDYLFALSKIITETAKQIDVECAALKQQHTEATA